MTTASLGRVTIDLARVTVTCQPRWPVRSADRTVALTTLMDA
jgi:hypothetical protein